jgi:excinuclease UvrABC helicase subunit UvrB
MTELLLKSEYTLKGDQPQALKALTDDMNKGIKIQVCLV